MISRDIRTKEKVKLTAEWMGHPAGSVMSLPVGIVRELERRGSVRKMEEKKPVEERKAAAAPPEKATKLQRPERDKMVREAINK